jgi:hypothetical protein
VAESRTKKSTLLNGINRRLSHRLSPLFGARNSGPRFQSGYHSTTGQSGLLPPPTASLSMIDRGGMALPCVQFLDRLVPGTRPAASKGKVPTPKLSRPLELHHGLSQDRV